MKRRLLSPLLLSLCLSLSAVGCGPEFEQQPLESGSAQAALEATPVVCEDRTVTEFDQQFCGYVDAPYGGGVVGVFVTCSRLCTVDFRRDFTSGGGECVFASYTCGPWACEKCPPVK